MKRNRSEENSNNQPDSQMKTNVALYEFVRVTWVVITSKELQGVIGKAIRDAFLNSGAEVTNHEEDRIQILVEFRNKRHGGL